MTNIAKPTEPCPFCQHSNCSVSDGSNGVHFRVICGNGNCRAAGPLERCAADAVSAWNSRVASAPQEPDCADCGQPHAEHRLSLVGSLLWCPGDAIRTYVAQEPVADDDTVHDFLREIYGRAFKEGAESTVEQWHAERSGRAERWPEAPSMPHKDCENEGSYQFGEDVKPKLLALLDRLQATRKEIEDGGRPREGRFSLQTKGGE